MNPVSLGLSLQGEITLIGPSKVDENDDNIRSDIVVDCTFRYSDVHLSRCGWMDDMDTKP